MMTSNAKIVHFIGICGAGMSAVAKLLRDDGWQISGSDSHFYPPISDTLTRLNLPCATPYDPQNIPTEATRIVIGKHARLTPELNPEVKRAFELRDEGSVVIQSFPEVLHELTAKTQNIVVAGSYGKSTTSTLISWLLTANQKSPSYFIGADPLDLESASTLGTSNYFVLEGDEYPSANWDHTSKFIYYNPKIVVLTSGEYDHFNEFASEDDYVSTYKHLIQTIPADGLLIACLDGKNVETIIAEAKCRVVTYALEADKSAYTVKDIHPVGSRTLGTVYRSDNGQDMPIAQINTKLIGQHNIENILAATVAMLEIEALSPNEIESAIHEFSGLRRRLEFKTSRSVIPVYEDLSSSKPKAMAAMDGVRNHYGGARRLVAIFEPYAFSFRSKKAVEWYPGMFEAADEVLLFCEDDGKSATLREALAPDEILQSITDGNACPAHLFQNKGDLLAYLRSSIQTNDTILLMTSGNLGGAISEIVDFVEQAFPVENAL